MCMVLINLIATIWQLFWGQRPVQHILWLDAKPARISLLVANSKSCRAAFAWRNVLQVNVVVSVGGRAIWWCIWVWIYQIDAKAWRPRCLEFVPRAFCRRNGPTEWETGGWNLVEVGFGKNLNFFTRTLPTWSLWSLQPGIVVVKIKAAPYCNNVNIWILRREKRNCTCYWSRRRRLRCMTIWSFVLVRIHNLKKSCERIACMAWSGDSGKVPVDFFEGGKRRGFHLFAHSRGSSTGCGNNWFPPCGQDAEKFPVF